MIKNITSFICLTAAFTPYHTASAQKAKERPNILVLIADDAGMDFGCYGNNHIHTPNIDKIAASGGLRFDKAFLTSPQSSPSRTSMMTGMFAHTIGTEDLHTPIDSNTRMIPSYLGEAGYRTGVIMKTHWGPEGNKQFDWVDTGMEWYRDEPVSENNPALIRYRDFIRKDDRPFFLWVGFIDPHRPYNTKTNIQQNNPDGVFVPPYYVNDPSTRRDIADYYDEISRMDRHIGIMMNELEEQELLENTVIIFLSDNGMPFPRAKGTLYDAGIRTPLLFSWKGKIKPGSVHDNGLISTVDLAPTILDLAGVSAPGKMYGKSFSSILFNPSEKGREYIFAERNWHDCDEYIRCVRTEKYKLIYNAYYEVPHGIAMDLSSSPTWYSLKKRQKEGVLTKGQQNIFVCPRPGIEIYDLDKDPYELNNVADEQAYYAKGKELVSTLLKWQEETGDHPYWKRRRPDQSDRITGFPIFPKRPDAWAD